MINQSLLVTISVLIAVLLCLSNGAMADLGLFGEKSRVQWAELPQIEGDWVAGGTYTVKWKYRPFRSVVEARKYQVCLDSPWIFEKCFGKTSTVSAKPDSDGYFSATITLPDDLGSSFTYYLKLKKFGFLGIGNDKFAESPQFPIVSRSKYRQMAEQKKLEQMQQNANNNQPLINNGTALVDNSPSSSSPSEEMVVQTPTAISSNSDQVVSIAPTPTGSVPVSQEPSVTSGSSAAAEPTDIAGIVGNVLSQQAPNFNLW